MALKGILRSPTNMSTQPHHVSFSSSGHRHSEPRQKHPHSEIAKSTLEAIERGLYLRYDLRSILAMAIQDTRYYPPDSLLSAWETAPRPWCDRTYVMLCPNSTLEGAHILANMQTEYASRHEHEHEHTSADSQQSRIGVLNFANPIKPGGGFLRGAYGQEESLMRSSTLYPSLTTRVAKAFYYLHNHYPSAGYYTHAMVYSPNIVLMRDDRGGWAEPLVVDVVSSAAVDARLVRQWFLLQGLAAEPADEERVVAAMKERMARILYLFELHGVWDIVLGAFGAGTSANSAHIVARIWAELVLEHGARFRHSFGHILFAVPAHEPAFEDFRRVFARYDRNDT